MWICARCFFVNVKYALVSGSSHQNQKKEKKFNNVAEFSGAKVWPCTKVWHGFSSCFIDDNQWEFSIGEKNV